MKEYKVIGVKSIDEAEKKMNEMAREGWEVVNTSYYYGLKIVIVITFVREKIQI